MKTFLAALVLFALIVGFVVWNTIDLQKTFQELLTLTEALPFEAEDFRKDAQTQETVENLYRLWDKKFSRIAFTGGYENCNRADEALGSLFIHFQNDNAEDFTHARLMLWDSLRRLKMLESFHFDSIF